MWILKSTLFLTSPGLKWIDSKLYISSLGKASVWLFLCMPMICMTKWFSWWLQINSLIACCMCLAFLKHNTKTTGGKDYFICAWTNFQHLINKTLIEEFFLYILYSGTISQSLFCQTIFCAIMYIFLSCSLYIFIVHLALYSLYLSAKSSFISSGSSYFCSYVHLILSAFIFFHKIILFSCTKSWKYNTCKFFLQLQCLIFNIWIKNLR